MTDVYILDAAFAQFSGCFSSVGCDYANFVTATSAKECCIDKDDGVYYLDGTTCPQCTSKQFISYTV